MNEFQNVASEAPVKQVERAAQWRMARAKTQAVEEASNGEEAADTLEVLEFSLGGQTYAFELAYVREVACLAEMCPLPGVPTFVMGITCLHGQMLAVVDLRKVFGLTEGSLRDSRQLIVLQSTGMEFGILGERILGVRRLSLAGPQTAVWAHSEAVGTYVKGGAADGTVVLCAAKLLADPQLVVRHTRLDQLL